MAGKFITVKGPYLRLSKELVLHIPSSLQELVRGRMTEELPALHNFFLEGFSHPNLSTKALGNPVLRDSLLDILLDILLPFPAGKDSDKMPSAFRFGVTYLPPSHSQTCLRGIVV
jgi:hypothetical protein